MYTTYGTHTLYNIQILDSCVYFMTCDLYRVVIKNNGISLCLHEANLRKY